MNSPVTILNMPVPPMLERALGYGGVADYVAFFWNQRESGLVFIDSDNQYGTGHWSPWLLFNQHRRIRPHLKLFHFGDHCREATHCFILDRVARVPLVQGREETLRFLRANARNAAAAPPRRKVDYCAMITQKLVKWLHGGSH